MTIIYCVVLGVRLSVLFYYSHLPIKIKNKIIYFPLIIKCIGCSLKPFPSNFFPGKRPEKYEQSLREAEICLLWMVFLIILRGTKTSNFQFFLGLIYRVFIII